MTPGKINPNNTTHNKPAKFVKERTTYGGHAASKRDWDVPNVEHSIKFTNVLKLRDTRLTQSIKITLS